MPFNSSTTVFHYNKDAFKAAGLDPEQPPKTWPEVALAAAKLKASGHKCPFTTSWQSWTQLESFSAWHNVEFATKRNGFNGLDTRLAITTPLHVRHIENLANMAQQGLFVYKGRSNAADATYVSGECAMITATSALYGDIKRNAKFAVRHQHAAVLPRRAGRAAEHRDRRRQPVGDGGQEAGRVQGRGAVLQLPVRAGGAGQEPPATPATCRSRPRPSSSPRSRASTRPNPGTDVSVTQMIRKTTDKSRGIRLGNFVQIRTIIDEELEQVWAGKKTAKQGLEDAKKRGDDELEKFEKANK